MSKDKIALSTLLQTIADCERFLQDFADDINWSNAEDLEDSILALYEEVKQIILHAQVDGLINIDWLKASDILTDEELSLEIEPLNPAQKMYAIYKVDAHGVSASREPFHPVADFEKAVTFIKRSAVKVLAHSTDPQIDRTAHYTHVSPANRSTWTPATLD